MSYRPSHGFNDNASSKGFIGSYPSVEAVIAADARELETVGGSFEAIADRMNTLLRKISVSRKGRDTRRSGAFRQHGYDHDEISRIPGDIYDETTPAGRLFKDITAIFHTPELLDGETQTAFVESLHTRGVQECPFSGCEDGSANSDYRIMNIGTRRDLWINELTSHLAGSHSLLEKGNKYEISAREFYEHFM